MNIDLPDVPRLRDKLAAGCLLLLVFLALSAGIWIGSTRVPIPENTAPAPAMRQRDGSLLLERKPDPVPPTAPHSIPRGTKEVRRITATAQPRQPDCDPVTITTSIVQDSDGLRAVTSAEGATVTEGVDVPIRPLNLAPPPRVWAAGASHDPSRDLYGAWVERDFGRLRLGAELREGERGGGVGAWLRVGVTF